uniref:Uncharacterized protein n=1 Tax=Phanerochaete carnosa TaxID=231932 RepID=A0A895KTE7_9APHY|nr:hypothetical protein K8K84_mgp042 [Phanerochaete carnosa]QRZ60410.1 hypothetical protein [Phanerochaete carnosa]
MYPSLGLLSSIKMSSALSLPLMLKQAPLREKAMLKLALPQGCRRAAKQRRSMLTFSIKAKSAEGTLSILPLLLAKQCCFLAKQRGGTSGEARDSCSYLYNNY